MNHNDRRQYIIERLQTDKKIDISELSSSLNTSMITIRKDVNQLCAEGIAHRFHGGAEYIQKSKEATLQLPKTPRSLLLEKIAAKAATLVHDNDTIFIGSGMTCLLLAHELKSKKGLTIITNNISALPDIMEYAKNTVVIGGEIVSVDGSTKFSWSEDCQQYMKNLYVDKAFTSCTGIDIDAGLTVTTIVSTYVYKGITDMNREWFLMADYGKFDKIGLYVLRPLSSVSCVISDKIPDKYLAYFQKQNIRAVTTEQP